MIYKRGGTYWYKFQFNGTLVRESAKTGNDKTARKIEAAHKTRLAEGLVGIREKKPVPTLRSLLKRDSSRGRKQLLSTHVSIIGIGFALVFGG